MNIIQCTIRLNGTGFVFLLIINQLIPKVMNRIVTVIVSLIITLSFADCQIVLKGVLLENYKSRHAGDTITLYGMKISHHDTFYYAKYQSGNYYIISSKRLFILESELNHLDKKWFEDEAIETYKRGWNLSKRLNIERKTLNYLAELENNNLIYKDVYLEDYLLGLLKNIHPIRLYKGRTLYFSVRLLNSEKEEIYTFENGTLLITTQLIAGLSDEKELYEKLVQAVIHVIYDHSYRNMDPFSEDPQRQLGIIYSSGLSGKGKQIAKNYMKFYMQNQSQEYPFHDKHYFIDRIANVVSYTAWQEYYSHHYMKSLQLLNKIIDAGFGTEEDYLLKAKLYRILDPGDDALNEAILLIEKAESLGNQKLVDIYSEKGILLMKIKKWDEALEAFTSYSTLIMNQPGSEMEMKWCIQMMHKCRRQMETDTVESAIKGR